MQVNLIQCYELSLTEYKQDFPHQISTELSVDKVSTNRACTKVGKLKQDRFVWVLSVYQDTTSNKQASKYNSHVSFTSESNALKTPLDVNTS